MQLEQGKLPQKCSMSGAIEWSIITLTIELLSFARYGSETNFLFHL
jgi:hypothetical protein